MMNRPSQWLVRGATGSARWAAGEFTEILPAMLFFFIALMVILATLKLFISQYSIEFYAFSKAALGALILGKVVLLMDWAESKRQSSSYPRALVIAFKTFIYGLAVIVLGISERVFHAYRHAGHFSDAVRIVIDNANLDRFLGCVLLISLLVSAYLAMEEISRAMGKGALFNLFFKAPVNTDTSSQGQ
jgi:hypothetical protein